MSLPAPDLPPAERALLRTLRDTRRRAELRGRVRVLALNGWSLAALARALDTHRSVVRHYVHHPEPTALSLTPVPTPPSPSPPPLTVPVPALPPHSRIAIAIPIAVQALDAHLLPVQRALLGTLSPSASRVRRTTATLSPSRTHADQLDTLLLDARSHAVPVPELAQACSLTPRAVRARLALASPTPIARAVLPPPRLSPAIYVVVWPAPGRTSLRWSTYVNATTRYPLALDERLLRFPAATAPTAPTAPAPFYLLTPTDAHTQLGWSPATIELVSPP